MLDYHAQSLRRHVRICLPKLEARFLSGQAAIQEIPQLLFRAAKRSGSELHFPAAADRLNAGEMGKRKASGICISAQGAHADHAHPAIETIRIYRGVFQGHRAAENSATAGSRVVPAPAGDEVRRSIAGGFFEYASAGYAVCLRVPPRLLAG